MKLRIKRFNKDLPLPRRDKNAAGYDLHCREAATIQPHAIGLISVNVAVEVPKGYFLLLAIRSSTPLIKGLILANGIGIVDPFYSGDQDEIKIQLLNITDEVVRVEKGELLTQALLVKTADFSWEEIETFGTDGHGGYQV